MKRKALQKEYGRLTPYERAVLSLRNALRARPSHADAAALEPPSFADCYWVRHWSRAMIDVSLLAQVRILQWLAVGLSRTASPEQTDRALLEPAAWLAALRRLERETGAPLVALDAYFGTGALEAAKMLLDAYPPEVRKDLGEAQYLSLRELWDAATHKVNESDASRVLPPIGAPKLRSRRRRRTGEGVHVPGEGPAGAGADA